MTETVEIWKPIEGFEGLYEISNLGRVKSLCATKWHVEKIRKEVIDHYGYSTCSLKKNGKYYLKKVHRLVAEAFIPNPQNLPQINHKDENKQNNSVSNLEWCTAQYNNAYGSHPDASRKKVIATKGNERIVFKSVKDCGNFFDMTGSGVSTALHRKNRKREIQGYRISLEV